MNDNKKDLLKAVEQNDLEKAKQILIKAINEGENISSLIRYSLYNYQVDNLDLIKLFVDFDPQLLDESYSFSRNRIGTKSNFFLYACYDKKLDLVRFLVDCNHKFLNSKDPHSGFSGIDYVISDKKFETYFKKEKVEIIKLNHEYYDINSLEIIKFIINHEYYDINSLNIETPSSSSALKKLLSFKYHPEINSLIDSIFANPGFNFVNPSSDIENPISNVISNFNIDKRFLLIILKRFVLDCIKGLYSLNTLFSGQKTALDIACLNNFVEIVERLIKHPDIKSEDLNKVLRHAIWYHKIEIIKVLLSYHKSKNLLEKIDNNSINLINIVKILLPDSDSEIKPTPDIIEFIKNTFPRSSLTQFIAGYSNLNLLKACLDLAEKPNLESEIRIAIQNTIKPKILKYLLNLPQVDNNLLKKYPEFIDLLVIINPEKAKALGFYNKGFRFQKKTINFLKETWIEKYLKKILKLTLDNDSYIALSWYKNSKKPYKKQLNNLDSLLKDIKIQKKYRNDDNTEIYNIDDIKNSKMVNKLGKLELYKAILYNISINKNLIYDDKNVPRYDAFFAEKLAPDKDIIKGKLFLQMLAKNINFGQNHIKLNKNILMEIASYLPDEMNFNQTDQNSLIGDYEISTFADDKY